MILQESLMSLFFSNCMIKWSPPLQEMLACLIRSNWGSTMEQYYIMIDTWSMISSCCCCQLDGPPMSWSQTFLCSQETLRTTVLTKVVLFKTYYNRYLSNYVWYKNLENTVFFQLGIFWYFECFWPKTGEYFLSLSGFRLHVMW